MTTLLIDTNAPNQYDKAYYPTPSRASDNTRIYHQPLGDHITPLWAVPMLLTGKIHKGSRFSTDVHYILGE